MLVCWPNGLDLVRERVFCCFGKHSAGGGSDTDGTARVGGLSELSGVMVVRVAAWI